MEQTQARVVLREAIRIWCQVVGRILKLERYLLPDDPINPGPAPQPPQINGEVFGGGLAAEHQVSP